MAIDKITADGIADNAIGTSKIGADVIVAEDIAANAVTVAELQDNAVTTAKILDANITTDKIADLGVTHAKLHNTMDLSSKTVTLPSLATLAVTGDLTVDTSTLKVNASNNFIGIGTSSPQKKVHIQDTTSDGIIILDRNGTTTDHQICFAHNYQSGGQSGGKYYAIGVDGSENKLVFAYDPNAQASLSADAKMVIDDSGNVGIGAPSPYKPLTIMAAIGGSKSDLLDLQSSNSGGGTQPMIRFGTEAANANTIGRCGFIDIPNYGGGFVVETNSTGGATHTTTEKFRIDKDGNVGIGSTIPTDQLHIFGGSGAKYIRIENGSSGNMGGVLLKTSDNTDTNKFFRQQGYYTEVGAHNNEGVRFNFQGTNRYTFRGSNGGNACFNASNSSNWNTTSDERIKTNIKTLEDGAIDKIKALRPVTFDYTDEWAEHNDLHKLTNQPGETEAEHYNIIDHGIDEEKQKGHIGWIAQEYKTVFPKDVGIDEETVGETKYEDFHTLKPESVVPTLVKALQEAVAKIDALENRIKTLEE